MRLDFNNLLCYTKIMKKKILRFILGIISLLITIFIFIMLAFTFSPIPGAMIVRHMFDSKVKITDKKTFDKVQGTVDISYDHQYKSLFKDNSYDLYLPKNIDHKIPVLVWIHGGGFIGGDKSTLKEFATKLASDAQIAVLSMNYQRAPESKYPNQVLQVGELISSLQKNKSTVIDLSHVMFGGDSAGAQIALEYVLTQTNDIHRNSLNIPHLLNKDNIRGTLSYCGPLNLKQMVNDKSRSGFMKFFVQTVAWSELGIKHWESSPRLEESSLVSQLTKDFPPTYITDGNSYSFEEQGMAFEKRLNQFEVPVQTLFFNHSTKKISHEYQFDYSKKEARQCYSQTLSFIEKYK